MTHPPKMVKAKPKLQQVKETFAKVEHVLISGKEELLKKNSKLRIIVECADKYSTFDDFWQNEACTELYATFGVKKLTDKNRNFREDLKSDFLRPLSKKFFQAGKKKKIFSKEILFPLSEQTELEFK